MIWTSAAIANRKKVAILITFLFPDFQQLWSSAEGEAKQTQCGTVSGVGLGSMVWRRYGALGDTRTVPWSGTGAVLRIGAGAVRRDDAYPASWSGTGAMVWKGASAALWGGAGVVLGANAALRHGMARIRRCRVRPL